MSANPLWDLPPELRENGAGSSLLARWSVVAERTIYFGVLSDVVEAAG